MIPCVSPHLLQITSMLRSLSLSNGQLSRQLESLTHAIMRTLTAQAVENIIIGEIRNLMNRRNFLKILIAGGTSVLLNRSFGQKLPFLLTQSRTLPDPQVNTFSSEIILNSRKSYHSGYSGVLSDQILANVLWAASQAPLIGSNRIDRKSVV